MRPYFLPLPKEAPFPQGLQWSPNQETTPVPNKETRSRPPKPPTYHRKRSQPKGKLFLTPWGRGHEQLTATSSFQ